jgi:hypothetical protein
MVWTERTRTRNPRLAGTLPIQRQPRALIQRSNSRTYQDEPNNITAAVCFKTLFGNIDIGLVLQWVAYNRFLGFDHVFMFTVRNASKPHLPNS